jgi:glycosyltransferase involved in cell wall biosynthesis
MLINIPMFSIIIPTHNRSNNLSKAIKSILSQTYTNFEIIIIDDGSTDKTASVVKSIEDSRIIYKYSENYGGPSRPRNIGITLAKGEWICFLDDDDWWSSEKLEVCKKYLNNKVDLLYHDLEIKYIKPGIFKRKITKSWQVKTPVIFDLLLQGNAISNSSVIVRKELLIKVSGFNESRDMISAEDYNAWMKIAQYSDKFLYLDQKLGYYLDQGFSISKRDMSIPARCAVNQFLPLLNGRQLKIVEANLLYLKASHHFQINNYAIAQQHFLLVLQKFHLTMLPSALMMLVLATFLSFFKPE